MFDTDWTKSFSHFWSALATEWMQRITVSQRAVVCRKVGPEESAEPSHPSNCQHLTRQKSQSLPVCPCPHLPPLLPCPALPPALLTDTEMYADTNTHPAAC